MKIKVIKCSSPNYWYVDRVNEQFEAVQVIDELRKPREKFIYKVVNCDLFFDKNDIAIFKESNQMKIIHV